MQETRNKKQDAKEKTFLSRIMLSAFCLLLSAFCLLPNASYSQDSIQKPKIGLVLSGGGAKGLAHIGVLKIIDSLNIKIDYIGGTSMGAIVGGLYASGYSGKELEYAFSQMDVDKLIQDFVPRSSKGFNQKRNDELYLLTLPFKKFKISSPRGLSKGMYNFNTLSRLTYHVKDIKDFSKLPIPFFCVATDIETGEEVLLKKGTLAKAMIASGALPTLYNPVEIEGKLLVDGGVKNNYPVEELRRLGADIVIGVDVQEGLKDRLELQSVTSVLMQISNFNTIEKMKNKILLTDIYIKPDVKGLSVLSFDKSEAIIKKGKEATIPQLEKLVKLQSNNKIHKEKTAVCDSISIKNISINDLNNYTRAYVIGKLNFKQNNKISFNKFEKGINSLNATDNYSSILYSFDDNDNLTFNLKENQVNTFIKFGMHYDDLYKSALLINLTHKKLISKNDVASLDIILGDNFRYNFDYYIDNGFYWSFGINSRLNTFNKNIQNDFNEGTIFSDLDINSINIDFSDFSNQVFVETIFSKLFLVGTGVELKHLKIQSPTLQNLTPIFDKSDYFSVFGNLKYDTFDKKYFPKSGWYINGEIKSYLFSSNFNNNFQRFSTIKGDVGIVKTFYKKLSLKLQSELGSIIGERTTPYFDFILGGYGYNKINNFQHFLGYDFLSLSGSSYIKGSAMVEYEILKKNYVNITANYANIGNKIFESTDWFSNPKFSGYAIGYGYDSLLGPIEIKHSWSPETRDHFTWFSIGYWF
ncbi:patatin-like phospholipase family protein [uncultured Flavobacterium sp.]|uniref:patatin-like phospholipase family protein n=1 Tax=uncultured Flavobacterium sp. TaxID=165435 RepID=UPI0030EBF2A2|tara:strand:- start:108573 stop:110831 length:2259 start_codon:yes stop_codon:yes gene_type:complete